MSACTCGCEVADGPLVRLPSTTQLGMLVDVAHGRTYREIARRRAYALSTVKNLMWDTRRRLGASNTAQALTIALQRGLLSLEELAE